MTNNLRVVLNNHLEQEALREVMPLFCEPFELSEDGFLGKLVKVAEEYSASTDSEFIVRVSVDQLPSLKAMRGQEPSGPVLLETYLLDHCLYSDKVAAQDLRREMKRQLYLALAKLTGISWPWGSLTGIRPTQVAREIWLTKEKDQSATLSELEEKWFLSSEKAIKGLKVALAEDAILSELDHKALMVYAGVPFCPGRCSYCSFICRDASRQESVLPEYAKAMVQEAEEVFLRLKQPVSAFYMGGGTPTSFSDEDFDFVLKSILNVLPLSKNAEICVEAGRPDTITDKKLRSMKEAGVTRLCINPQSMHDTTLEKVGRFHDKDMFLKCLEMARSMNFEQINADLILGLPGEGATEFLQSVGELIALDLDSITLHTLALKRSARLHEEASETYLPLRFPDPEMSRAMREADQILEQAGYAPYYMYRQKNVRGGLENTGYSKEGKVCIYNVGMMSDEISIVGLGSGSSSKKVRGRRVERLHNSKDIADYSARIHELAEKKWKFFDKLDK